SHQRVEFVKVEVEQFGQPWSQRRLRRGGAAFPAADGSSVHAEGVRELFLTVAQRPAPLRKPHAAPFPRINPRLSSCCLFDLERWRSNAGSRSSDPAVAGA